jgi:putrescine aminotransferase
LEIVVGENLPGNAAEVGAYFLGRLEELEQYNSVGDVRGIGLMAAVEFVNDRQTKEPIPAFDPYLMAIQKKCMDEGVWVRIQGNKMIFSPPLVFEKTHVDKTIEAVHAALNK